MFKKVLILLLVLAMPFFVLAQSSGKLIGVVNDKDTGEPLPGVNVVLQGTFYGATTDVDGYYIVLTVPVGTYTVEATYVGYTPMLVQGVKVSADITTETNFELQPTELELEEAIVITAERPLVEKHVTHSAAKITSEEIELAPIRGMQAFMAYMPSVVVQNGAVNIRGGRGEEVGYYLDGASTMNPLNRTNAVHVIQEATEEMQVLTGGFGAEYGDANSGIVKTQLKQGTAQFNFSLTAETDKFASEGEKFLDTYSYRDHLIVGTASGPITNNIRFFVAGEMESKGDSKKRFTEGFTLANRVDVNPYSSSVNAGNPDTVDYTYPSGFTPNNWYDRYAANATMSFNFDPFRFRLSGVYNRTEQVATNNPVRSALENRWVTDLNDHILVTGKFTHVLSAKTYYDVSLNYYYRKTDEEDPYFGNDWKKWADSAAVYNATNGEVVYRDAWQAERNYEFNGVRFLRNGQYEDYDQSKQQYFGGGLDFVSQVTKNHEVKFGFNAKSFTIRQFDIDPYMMAHTDINYTDAGGNHLAGTYYPTLGDIPYKDHKNYIDNTFGYDYMGNEIDSEGRDGPRNPLIAAAYVTDKVEYKDLIVNLGLRLDYFDSDDYGLKNPSNAKVDQETGTILESEWEKLDAHIHFSPRIGISFPVSETTVFYTQYGKFVQMPEFNDFYYNSFQYGRQMVTGGYYYGGGAIGYGFDPIYTTSYELGFRKQLGDFAAIDIAGFYKNIQGQIYTTRVNKDPGADIVTYLAKTNGDFATNKGLEFKLTMRRFNRLQGQLNYTLTDAEGTGSGEASYVAASYRGSQRPTVTAPLDYAQTHKGAVILDYRFGEGDGGPVLENFGVNLMYRFSSGHPYTHVTNVGGQNDPYTGGTDYMTDTRSRAAEEAVNTSTTPWTSNVDMRIDKSFDIMDQLQATVYVRVINLFNTKNVLNVYQDTGSDTDDGYITDPDRYISNYDKYNGAEYLETYNALNTQNGSAYLSQLGREIWGHPRQILLGIKLNY